MTGRTSPKHRTSKDAADAWTPGCGLDIGDVVCHGGEHLRIVAFEQVEHEHSGIGWNTGWLICLYADGHLGLVIRYITSTTWKIRETA